MTEGGEAGSVRNAIGVWIDGGAMIRHLIRITAADLEGEVGALRAGILDTARSLVTLNITDAQSRLDITGDAMIRGPQTPKDDEAALHQISTRNHIGDALGHCRHLESVIILHLGHRPRTKNLNRLDGNFFHRTAGPGPGLDLHDGHYVMTGIAEGHLHGEIKHIRLSDLEVDTHQTDHVGH